MSSWGGTEVQIAGTVSSWTAAESGKVRYRSTATWYSEQLAVAEVM